jgi:hypothetical protein
MLRETEVETEEPRGWTVSLFVRSKATAQNNRVEVKGREWTFQVSRQTTRDSRTMFLVKAVRVRYIPASQSFVHDDLTQPVWLTPEEYAHFANRIMELAARG